MAALTPARPGIARPGLTVPGQDYGAAAPPPRALLFLTAADHKAGGPS